MQQGYSTKFEQNCIMVTYAWKKLARLTRSGSVVKQRSSILEPLVRKVTTCCIKQSSMAVIRVSLGVSDTYDSVSVPVDQSTPGQLKSPPKIILAPGNCDLICCREFLKSFCIDNGELGGR